MRMSTNCRIYGTLCTHRYHTRNARRCAIIVIHLVDVRNGSKEINLLNIRPTCSIEAKLVAGLFCLRPGVPKDARLVVGMQHPASRTLSAGGGTLWQARWSHLQTGGKLICQDIIHTVPDVEHLCLTLQRCGHVDSLPSTEVH